MQPPVALARVLQWRWAPCAALVSGSLAYVLLAISLIPDGWDPTPAGDTASSFGERSGVAIDQSSGNEFSKVDSPSPPADPEVNASGATSPPTPDPIHRPSVQSFFQPNMDLPPPLEAPPDPAPEESAAATVPVPTMPPEPPAQPQPVPSVPPQPEQLITPAPQATVAADAGVGAQ